MAPITRFSIYIALSLISSLPALAQDPPVIEPGSGDETYRALRAATLSESFDVDGLTLRRDLAVFRLSGKVAFSAPVRGRVVLGVFTGRGELIAEPTLEWEQRSMTLMSGAPSLNEAFSSAVLWFTDETYDEIREAGTPSASVDLAATKALERIRGKLRNRRETPRSYLEAILSGEDMDNIEADVLADVYQPGSKGQFNAYVHGSKHDDLRYFVRPRGAVPQMLSPEETALLFFNPGGDAEGVWYLSHLLDEYEEGTASSGEDHSPVDAKHYEIETTVERGKKLDGRCIVTFEAREDGVRILKFGLLPELRVSSVTVGGVEADFIQEHHRKDGSFYAILPEAAKQGEEYSVEIAYRGDEVVRSEGGGNFAVGARTSWYPSLGSFKDRATFDLTYHYPKRFVLVSVGTPVGKPESDKKQATSRWKSDVPLAVAGFNYGDFSMQERQDEPTNYDIESYATQKPPDFLVSTSADLPQQGRSRANLTPQATALSPKRMLEKILGEGQLSMRIFTKYFGELPYGRIALTQQPSFNSGQSWPTLAYLPVSAYLDSTTRWTLLGSSTFKFSNFIQEVTAHEVAHQWWGHVVGWSTYHDQWLSEGLADFSASLFVQATSQKHEQYLRFLERWQQSILEKNRFGYAANDVGPLWMGQRLISAKTSSAYRRLVYPKGGYVIHMLRQMMHDRERGDQPFIEMMHDFVKTHHNQNATTESFKAIVEKHINRDMDMQGNGKMDWFFNQWVYGQEAPSYDLQYSLTPGDDGSTMLKAVITQSGVSDNFAMPVPIYLEMDGRVMKLGSARMVGNTTSQPIEVPLPKRPDRVMLNANWDILAERVTAEEL